MLGKDPPCVQAHSFRRGTCSILKKLGLPLEDINSHMGWTIDSAQFKTYYRFVVPTQVDSTFYFAVLPQMVVRF